MPTLALDGDPRQSQQHRLAAVQPSDPGDLFHSMRGDGGQHFDANAEFGPGPHDFELHSLGPVPWAWRHAPVANRRGATAIVCASTRPMSVGTIASAKAIIAAAFCGIGDRHQHQRPVAAQRDQFGIERGCWPRPCDELDARTDL